MPRRRLTPLDGRTKRARLATQRQAVRHSLLLTEYEGRLPHPTIAKFGLGPMTITCNFCAALRFKGESKNCCHNGKVHLQPPSPFPHEIQTLFISNTRQAHNFKDNIRQYNSALAFASFGANIVLPPGRGPYAFRIHGQIYHRTGSLHPPDNTDPLYSQLYIIEGNQAVETRMRQPQNQQCTQELMMLLSTALNQLSPYAAAYRQMQHVEESVHQHAAANNTVPPTITLYMKRGNDQRRYNEPTHDEVAAIFVSSDGAPPPNRDVVVYPRDELPRNISYLSGNCDPMVYPLFFPRGDLGWFPGIEHSQEHCTAVRNTITLLQFYSFRLAVRNVFNPIFYGGKLFQQFIVDAYVKTEASRLDYIRKNQSNLRVDLYQGLMDHIQSQSNDNNLSPGKIVVLPSSFQGSPRAMQQHFQDAMAIVTRYGKPDLFLTFTCNPKCIDVLQCLPAGQRAEHRPDVVARVFKLHLKELLYDITERHILGVPVGHIHVIEFQKRGLPHCHLLIMLSAESRLKEPSEVDSLICAEIPDPSSDPELHEIIKSSMVHGPCGVFNMNAVCMADGKCTKDYPKEFCDQTVFLQDGYPLYQRRDNGVTIKVGPYEVDNRWIVPYNPYLSKKYNAHINLEACTSVKSVKYLFKYVYKGHDCANIEITAANEITYNEVNSFLNARYVSAPEAFWRLSEFPMHKQSHTIIRLPVHLPQQQRVYFEAGKHQEAAQQAAMQDTMLTAWFKLNIHALQHYCYSDIPNYYVYDAAKREWKPRKKGGDKIISRLYYVSPKHFECFCLRLLLLHVSGATCFEDLRTVNGHEHDSFKEACLNLHLLTDDSEWDKTLEEASAFKMPAQLRLLFATICVHCEPVSPLQLWNRYKETMIEDFTHFYQMSAQNAEARALQDIEKILRQNNMNCLDMGLPSFAIVETQHDEFDLRDQQAAYQAMTMLNEQQRHLVDSVLQAVCEVNQAEDLKCRAYFLDGPGGSGKTMVYNTLISCLQCRNVRAASSAWTGIAATLLSGGRTVHSLFKLPVPILDNSTCNISPTSVHAEYLRSITVFIIDEASMVPIHALSAIDKMLRDITGLDVPFGGKIFVLGGDFRQVLPIIPRRPRTVIVENCLKSSTLWSKLTIIKLTKNMRTQQNEQAFAKWLLQLGNELTCDIPECAPNSVEIPKECNIVNGDIIADVFNDFSDPRKLAHVVILTPMNEDTLKLNNEVLKKLPGLTKVYLSTDKAICDIDEEAQNYPVEFLHSITPNGMPPHKLLLKVNSIIMLLRNLDITKGLCNGTRLIVHHLHEHVIDAEVLTGSNHGRRILIPRIKLAPSDIMLPFTLARTQFPVRLSYSMTIHKSQGQTFEKLGIYLPLPVFSHGQLYVAFSRARRFSDIYIKVLNSALQGDINGRILTQNVVYREVLA